MAYVDGHFMDFYDYNKTVVFRNDYLPIVYAIFALVMLPLKLLGLTHSVSWSSNVVQQMIFQLAVCKTFLAIVFFATVYVIQKISALMDNQPNRFLSGSLFATAPIAIFAVFIFGQYDIIGLFFTILGFYYYAKRDLTKFSIFFSIAIGFKFFALIPFIPLLLLAEKNLLRLLKYGLIGIAVTLFQMILYSGSPAFRSEIFTIAYGKLGDTTGKGWSFGNIGIYAILGYCGLCLYAFLKKRKGDYDFNKTAILVCIAAYAFVFVSVAWHPQWIIIPMPFFALAARYIKNKNIFYVVDIVGMLAFIWCVESTFPGIGLAMMTTSLIRLIGGFFHRVSLFYQLPLLPIQLFPFFKIVFELYLFSPLLIMAYEKYFPHSADSNMGEPPRRNYYFMARFLVGLAIFLIPVFFCVFASPSLAEKIDANDARIRYLERGTIIQSGHATSVGEILRGTVVAQTFKAEHDQLSAVSILFATSTPQKSTEIKITLVDDQDREIASTTVNAKELRNGAYYNFSFSPIADSAGQTYKIQLTSSDGMPGSAATAWASLDNVYPDGVLTINQTQQPGDLLFCLFYQLWVK